MKILRLYIVYPVRHIVLVLFLSAWLASPAYPQPKEKDNVKAGEKNYSEELYIRTDRDLYIAGEKVWVKIFKLNGLTITPSDVSKIVYVDVLDADNNPVRQLKVQADGFTGSCDFRLPDTLRTGNYVLRSYTNWMQNFPQELFSYKIISVINPFRISDIKIPSLQQSTDSVIFFPEGGSLVNGIRSTIGFKCINSDGEPVHMTGALVTADNDTLCRVFSASNGFGWASVNPDVQTQTFLVTTGSAGGHGKFKLPRVQKEGILLTAIPGNEKSTALLRLSTSDGYKQTGKNIYKVLNSPGLSETRSEITPGNNGAMDLLKNDLPAGLSHLMIVDEQGKILTHRWIFNETGRSLSYNVKTAKENYSTREKIRVSIIATDERGKPAESDFSVSVAKAASVSNNSFDNIKSRQLPGLTTYTIDSHSHNINDQLLFYDSDILSPETARKSDSADPVYLPEIEGHLVSGNIKSRTTGEPIKNQNISLSLVGKRAQCHFAKTNSKGEFYINTAEHGLREIVIQPLSETLKDYYVELNSPFTPATKKYNYGVFFPDTNNLSAINNIIISSQINNIYEPYRQERGPKQVPAEKPDFYGKPDNTIFLSQYIELTSLEEVVKEIIPGVSAVKKNDKINFRMAYQYQTKPFEDNPLVLVDGVPVYDLEKVLSINSKDVDKIDVFTTRYFISDIVMDGILHFVTKKGNLSVIDLDRSVYRVEYEFPVNHNEFYSPDYSDDKLLNNHIPDFRNTLYWNPDMKTDRTGSAVLEFYSSDETGEYIITVQGITPDGKTGEACIPINIQAR